MKVKTGLGLDSHRFIEGDSDKPLILGGVIFDDAPALSGNSDADVILHAVTDAISGVTGVTVIGAVADQLCRDGITDSKAYLAVALESLGDWRLTHVSIVLECLRPKIDPKVPELRASVADLLGTRNSRCMYHCDDWRAAQRCGPRARHTCQCNRDSDSGLSTF